MVIPTLPPSWAKGNPSDEKLIIKELGLISWRVLYQSEVLKYAALAHTYLYLVIQAENKLLWHRKKSPTGHHILYPTHC